MVPTPNTKVGTTKWFNAKRGFGFVTCDESKTDYFVHKTNIVAPNPAHGVPSLATSEKVLFTTFMGKKGLEAGNVSAPDGATLKGSKHARGRRNEALLKEKYVASPARSELVQIVVATAWAIAGEDVSCLREILPSYLRANGLPSLTIPTLPRKQTGLLDLIPPQVQRPRMHPKPRLNLVKPLSRTATQSAPQTTAAAERRPTKPKKTLSMSTTKVVSFDPTPKVTTATHTRPTTRALSRSITTAASFAPQPTKADAATNTPSTTEPKKRTKAVQTAAATNIPSTTEQQTRSTTVQTLLRLDDHFVFAKYIAWAEKLLNEDNDGQESLTYGVHMRDLLPPGPLQQQLTNCAAPGERWERCRCVRHKKRSTPTSAGIIYAPHNKANGYIRAKLDQWKSQWDDIRIVTRFPPDYIKLS